MKTDFLPRVSDVTFTERCRQAFKKAWNLPCLSRVANTGVPKSSIVKNDPGSGRSWESPTSCGWLRKNDDHSFAANSGHT